MSVESSSSSKSIDVCEEFRQYGVYESAICRAHIDAATNVCFPTDLVTLVMQHLSPIAPTTRNWETEWTGPILGRDVITFALDRARTPLSEEQRVTYTVVTDETTKVKRRVTTQLQERCVDLVVDYLEKSNKFGAERIENRYGRNRILQYCPKYNRDYPLPPEIDDLMQTPLKARFTHPDALVGLPPHVTRMTHLIGLYLKPEGMTASISQELVRPCWTQFAEYSWRKAIQDDDNTPTKTTQWRWFAEFAIGRNKSWENQLALIPAGLEPPVPSDTFCEFTHFACTARSWTLGEKPPTYTRTSKVFHETRVAFGLGGSKGLSVHGSDIGPASRYGIALSGSS